GDHITCGPPRGRKAWPRFCKKPIGKTVEGTRRILALAKEHGAPLMSSSLFRHEFGMEQALRMRDSGDYGPIEFVLASQAGGYSPENWFVYGQHPVWSVVTLRGAGAKAVSMVGQEATARATITYDDRGPAEVWYGRPGLVGRYNEPSVYFAKKSFDFTPAIEGD